MRARMRRGSRTAAALSAMLMAGAVANAAETRSPARSRELYEAIVKKLDTGGDMLTVVNAAGYAEQTLDRVVKSLGQSEAGRGEIGPLATKVHAFVKEQGLYAVTGYGFSSLPQAEGHYRIKLFTSREERAAALPLWRGLAGGQPRALQSAAFWPADTVLAAAGSGEWNQLWRFARLGVTQLAPPAAQQAFEAWIKRTSAMLGSDLEALIGSLGDESFLCLQLSRTETIRIPGPAGQALAMPKPTLLIGLKLNDDTLPKMLEAQWQNLRAAGAPLPIAVTQVGTTRMHALSEPAPLPVPLQPAYAQHGGFFLVGSTPQTVQAAIQAFDSRKGLVATDEYRKALAGLPPQNNGIFFMGARLGATLTSLRQAALAESPSVPKAVGAFFDGLSRGLGGTRPATCAMVAINQRDGVLIAGNSSLSGAELAALTAMSPVVPLLGAIAVPKYFQLVEVSDERNAEHKHTQEKE